MTTRQKTKDRFAKFLNFIRPRHVEKRPTEQSHNDDQAIDEPTLDNPVAVEPTDDPDDQTPVENKPTTVHRTWSLPDFLMDEWDDPRSPDECKAYFHVTWKCRFCGENFQSTVAARRASYMNRAKHGLDTSSISHSGCSAMRPNTHISIFDLYPQAKKSYLPQRGCDPNRAPRYSEANADWQCATCGTRFTSRFRYIFSTLSQDHPIVECETCRLGIDVFEWQHMKPMGETVRECRICHDKFVSKDRSTSDTCPTCDYIDTLCADLRDELQLMTGSKVYTLDDVRYLKHTAVIGNLIVDVDAMGPVHVNSRAARSRTSAVINQISDGFYVINICQRYHLSPDQPDVLPPVDHERMGMIVTNRLTPETDVEQLARHVIDLANSLGADLSDDAELVED